MGDSIRLSRLEPAGTMAMNGGAGDEPAWWLNLREHPEASVDLADGQRAVKGRGATGAERSRLWDRWREIDANLDAYELPPRPVGTFAGRFPRSGFATRPSAWRGLGCDDGGVGVHRRPSRPRLPRTAPSPARSPGTPPARDTRHRSPLPSVLRRARHSEGRTLQPRERHRRRPHTTLLRNRNTAHQLEMPSRRSTARLAGRNVGSDRIVPVPTPR